MHSWPNLVEDHLTESISISSRKDTRKEITKMCVGGMGNSLVNLSIKTGNFDRNDVVRDIDEFSVEERGEAKSDTLPWSEASNIIKESLLAPHTCSTECWHQDPVEVTARIYERADRFEEALKLRVSFKGLSILHMGVLQWYLWAQKQQTHIDLPKKKAQDKNNLLLDRTTLTRYPSIASIDLEDSIYTRKEPSSEILDSTLANIPNSPATDKEGVKENHGINSIDSRKKSTHQLCTLNQALYEPTDARGSCKLSSGRIITHQLKDRVFRNCYPGAFGADNHPKCVLSGDTESAAYKSHARWVLESNVMSDEEDEDFVSLYEVIHPIFPEVAQTRPEKERNEHPGQFTKYTWAGDSWDDLFFLEDSDSSDYPTSKVFDSSDDDNFPTISGEELEKLLEEAKGTIQFHRWQNAPTERHQKEFKTLINLHRSAKEAEVRNQKRWKAIERRENGEKAEVTTSQNPRQGKKSHKPPISASRSCQILGNKPHALSLVESDLPTHVVPKRFTVPQGPSRDPKVKLQPIEKETEDYCHITADDVKFLRELKKKLEQVEVTPKTQAIIDDSSSPSTSVHPNPNYKGSLETQSFNENTLNMTMRKLEGHDRSETSGIVLESSSQRKSLRNFLRTTKTLAGINRYAEYENLFPQHEPEAQANNNLNLPPPCYNGPIPKRHYVTAPSGDVSFHPDSGEHHPFFQTAGSPAFKKLVMSTGRFCNPKANISQSGFWVTESLFITSLGFHPWAPSTTIKSLNNQIEDFKLHNGGIELFVSNSWFGPSDDPEAIKVFLRAWDTSARIAIFEIEDKIRATPNFIGIDKLIEEDVVLVYNGAHIATVGYNSLGIAGGDSLGLGLLNSGSRSITFGEITISGDCETYSQLVSARLESGFTHGSYGRICTTMGVNQKNSSIIGLVTGQCEERGLLWPSALSDFVSTFPEGFKDELRRISRS